MPRARMQYAARGNDVLSVARGGVPCAKTGPEAPRHPRRSTAVRTPLFFTPASIACVLVGASASLARPTPPASASAPPDEPAATSVAAPVHAPDDLLAGPSFAAEADSPQAARSLVARDFAGALKPLEVRPEQAALDLLDLSPEQRAAAQRVLDDRAVRLDSIVRKNLKLLAKGQTARASNDPAERRAVFSEFADTFGGLLDHHALSDSIAATLPTDEARRYRTIVDEYWAALEANAENAPAGPMGRRQGPAVQVMGQEIKRSFERVVGQGRERLDAMLAELQLTPEQEGKIRATIMDASLKAQGREQGSLQKLKLFRQIAKDLTPEQRARLRELVQAERGG